MSEIVNATKDYTQLQDDVIRNIHKHIAALLPELGRDYTVDITFESGTDEAKVRIEGKTRIGQVFAEEVMNYFNSNN